MIAGSHLIRVLVLFLAVSAGYHNPFFEAALDGTQVVPPTPSSGTAQVTWYWWDEDRTTFVSLEYSGLSDSVTGAFAAVGSDSQNGPILRTFATSYFPTGWSFDVPWTYDDYEPLMDTTAYVVITTKAYPSGEVRGRFIPNHLPATKRVTWGSMRSSFR
jgi:hypothetical protein